MRNLVLALVVVGLLAVPSFGAVNVSLTAVNSSIAVGETATIYVSGQGDVAGLFSLAGNVTASTSDGGALTSTAASSVWDVNFSPTFGLTPKPGTAGVNGGWSLFGSEQTNYLSPDANYAKAAPVAVFSYKVVGATQGHVTLHFAPATVSGYKCTETNKAVTMGTITDVVVTITPEPATMVMLALGGLALIRRRR
jgi:hypothetical protein